MTLIELRLATSALVGWMRRPGEGALDRQATARSALRATPSPIRPEAARRLRSRQAAWRLRC